MPDPDDIKSPFRAVMVEQEQVDRRNRVAVAAEALHAAILEEAPPSRERSLAITKLEELAMWTNKAIAMNPRPAVA